MSRAEPVRPSLDHGGAVAREAAAAVDHLLEVLQLGWDRHDADITDGPLADDVLWGSPFGETVQGYEDLHAIHVRLKRENVGGSRSRFEVVQVLSPTPDVTVAHVRRDALDERDAFSEMAMYVLVRREDTWWVAAGQNTPIKN